MACKLFYIEDLDSDSRKSDLLELGFQVEQYDPERDMNSVVDRINSYQPDVIIMDYRLNNGKQQVYYDAPTIAATLRNKHRAGFREIPIILISNERNIADFYKDFLNQDLFDHVIEKHIISENKEFFQITIESYVEAYSNIQQFRFDLPKILGLATDSDYSQLIHSSIIKMLLPRVGQIYEYSRFINTNLIYAIGTLIGEDVLAARLGVDKSSEDWSILLPKLDSSRYYGIFGKFHGRWWAEKVENWWAVEFGQNNLRRLNSIDRVNFLNEKFKLNLRNATPSYLSKSSKFWTICKGSRTPLDPFDGIEIIKKDYKPWQEKEYFSISYAMEKIEKEKNYIDETDIKYLRELSKKL